MKNLNTYILYKKIKRTSKSIKNKNTQFTWETSKTFFRLQWGAELAHLNFIKKEAKPPGGITLPSPARREREERGGGRGESGDQPWRFTWRCLGTKDQGGCSLSDGAPEQPKVVHGI
jgi:hypothetical protein